MSAPYTSINPTGGSRNMPMRALFDRYKRSPLSWDIVESDGIEIGAWYPHRNLPASWIDIKTQEGVVINKGQIVALASPQVVTSGGMTYPIDSGNLYTYVDPTTGTTQSGAMWDAGLRGYDSTMGGVIVPANGGYDTTFYYTTADVTLATLDVSGTVVAATGSGNWQIQANQPVGVAREDIYQDIRGRYLNGVNMGEQWKGIICDRYVKVPYVNQTLFNAATNSGVLYISGFTFGHGYTDSDGTAQRTDMTSSGGYVDTARLHAFLYDISGVNNGGLRPGGLVKSDNYGNWMPQYNGTRTTVQSGDFEASGNLMTGLSGEVESGQLLYTSGGSVVANTTVSGYLPSGVNISGTLPVYFSVENAVTEQTVGRIVELSNGFPQDLMDTVDTYPTTDYTNKMPGTSTGGLPQELFTFAYDAIYYSSSGTITPSASTIVNAVRSGVFGIARIQVMVA